MTKINLDSCSAICCFVLALLVGYGATQLGLGSATNPGAGFIFFWSGLLLALLSLVLLAGSLLKLPRAAQEIKGPNWVAVALVLMALVFYALFLEKLGFVLSTFILLSFVLGICEGKKWPRVLAAASAAALGSFALFELWLRIRLPKGIFGF